MLTSAVVIPFYNAPRNFLAPAIESALDQTRPFKAVFAVDDCSTDGSAAIAREYERYGVRVFATPRNSGQAAARNMVIRQPVADLIFMLDADDRFEPWHNEALSSLLEEFPKAGFAGSRVNYFGDIDRPSELHVPERTPLDALLPLLRINIVNESGIAARRSALLAVGAYDESYRRAEDYDLWLRMAERFPYVCTHRITSNYRVHVAQMSNVLTKQFDSAWRARLRAWAFVLANRSPEEVRLGARMMREAWQLNMRDAWTHTDRLAVEFLLELRDKVPDGDDLVARWRRRLRYAWLPWLGARRMWLSLPEQARHPLRRLLGNAPPTRHGDENGAVGQPFWPPPSTGRTASRAVADADSPAEEDDANAARERSRLPPGRSLR